MTLAEARIQMGNDSPYIQSAEGFLQDVTKIANIEDNIDELEQEELSALLTTYIQTASREEILSRFKRSLYPLDLLLELELISPRDYVLLTDEVFRALNTFL